MTVVDTDFGTLEAFFFTEIEQVQEQKGQNLPLEVEAYIVGLLARFALKPQVAGRKSPALALQYLEARNNRGSARAQALRGVGDRALFISGVAPKSMKRSPVNVRYVKGIGEAAYREVSSRSNRGPVAVLGVLASMFDEVSEVIGCVARPGSENEDLLTVYERWRQEGGAGDLSRLVTAGVLLDPERSDVLQ